MTFRVLLVDDSTLVRTAVADILKEMPDVSVSNQAANGQEALDIIERDPPDLMILDVEMPIMNGLTVLEEIKKRDIDVPVLMLSGLTKQGADTTIRSLELGAIDFITKPTHQSKDALREVHDSIQAKVYSIMRHREKISTQTKIAEIIDIFAYHHSRPVAAARAANALSSQPKKTGSTLLPPQTPSPSPSVSRKDRAVFPSDLLVIGSSTGGPQALHLIFKKLPADFPVPIVVVQHMPALFTGAFASRLDNISALNVAEASDGMRLERGSAVIAPGNQHLSVRKSLSGGLELRLSHDPPVHAHRPSIDYTLKSAIESFGKRCAALIMTGMGWDGAQSMKHLFDLGALTVAQDEQSSIVYGMNKRAVELGAIHYVAPLENLVEVLVAHISS